MSEEKNVGVDFTEIRGDRLLTEFEAAEFLGLSPRTLQDRRRRNLKPDFVALGRSIRYRLKDLIAWIEANVKSPGRAA